MSDQTRYRDPNFLYPGELLEEQEMRVTALGTGMPFSRRRQASPGWLVELGNGDVFIFDLGTGSSANLNALGAPHSKLDKVFLTHLHIDHWGDLGSLYALGMVRGRFTPLHVWGPSGKEPHLGTAAFGKGFKQMMAWDIESRTGVVSSGEGGKVIFHEFDYATPVKEVYNENGVVITAFPALHCLDGPNSYRLDWNGLSFVYLGDGKASRYMVENGQNADILIHEAFVPAPDYAKKTHLPIQIAANIVNGVHAPPRAAGKVFSLTKPRLAVMYHLMLSEDLLIPILDDLRTTYDGPVVIAEDLMVFNITREHITQRMAVVAERAWPVPSHQAGRKRPTLDPKKLARLSPWLQEAEIPVKGVDTTLKGE